MSAPHAVYWSILLLLAVAVGVSSFTGIENHPAYSGAVIQALEPGSFSSDEFMSPTRPIMMSVQYKVLVPLIGRLWLDDRFVCLLNCLVAVGSLLGLDRILVAFGMRLFVHRLILLAVFCVGHGLLNNIAYIVNPNEFNPTSLAKPLSIWMVYFAIADRRPWKWALMGTIVAGMSVKNAWTPWLMCLVLYTGRFSRKTQCTLYGCAAVAAIVFLSAGHWFLSPSDGSWPLLWETLRLREGGEGDPFLALSNVVWPYTVLFLVLCVACFWVRLPEAAPQKHMRRLVLLTLLIWFLGGAYYNWTPLFLQIPQIIPFAPTRGLWLPQLLVFAALGSWALHATPKIGALGTVSAVALLMAIPFNTQNPKQGCALMVLLLIFAAAWAVARSKWFGASAASTCPRFSWLLGVARTNVAECILLPSFLIFVFTVFGVGIKSRWRAYETLWATGVMGDNRMTARWIGVAEYLHLHTPADAKVLAMCWARDGYSRHDYRSLPASKRRPAPDDLVADGAIRSRSGRASPVPGMDEKYNLSYQSHLDVRERWRVLNNLGHAWQTHDVDEVQNLMKHIGGTVDYIVVPTSEADWVNRQVPYDCAATVGKYTILRCLDGVKSGDKP